MFSIKGYGVVVQDLAVSGAPDSAANGAYVHQGLIHGFQYWRKDSFYYIYNEVYTGTSSWNIDDNDSSTDGSVVYYVPSETGSPVGVSG